MPRLLFCSLLAASLATIAPAAPVPTHLMPKETPIAFPTKPGTTWVYMDSGTEKTLVISRSVDEIGGKLVTTEWVDVDGNRTPNLVYSVVKGGIFIVESGGSKFDSPVCRLKLPHRVGLTWETKISSDNADFKFSMLTTAGPMEKVIVPAGEYLAARIELGFLMNGIEQVLARRQTHWYADGVGLVKSNDYLKLKSFKPGKD